MIHHSLTYLSRYCTLHMLSSPLQYTRGFGGEWRYIDLYRFITTVVTLFLVLVQFILTLFKDRARSSTFLLEEVRACVCVKGCANKEFCCTCRYLSISII